MQKLYYSISEVCQMIDEEQHILRYWEKEFPQLKPKKNRGGNRIYSKKDIQIISLIRKLLREDKLSLKGAKEQLPTIIDKGINEGIKFSKHNLHIKQGLKTNNAKINNNLHQQFNKKELEEILDLLKKCRSFFNQNSD